MRFVENDTRTLTSTNQEVHTSVTIADIWEAYKLLKSRLHHTPLAPSRTLRDITGADIYLKAENMQRSGSFKVRGASYKLSRLSEEEYSHGVITASAGNHAQGVAIAASQYHISCTIVMPETAPLAKVTATQGYGAEVVLHGFTYDDAYQYCLQLQQETGATFIHAFDDPDIIAGQGTLGLEMLSDLPDADALIVPIGGGGLIAGITIAARALRPNIKIIGVQAEGAAGCRASLEAGELRTLPSIATIADGIAVKRPGTLTFPIIQNLVGRFIEHGLATAGRYFVIHTRLTDRPGELMRLLAIISEMRINVIDVRHQRISSRLPIMQREETLTLETRDRAQCEQLLQRLRSAGYVVEEAQALE